MLSIEFGPSACVLPQAALDIQGIKRIWSLPDVETGYDKYLIQSYTFETRILRVDGDEMSECDMEGASVLEPSLFCGEMLADMFVQV